MEAFPLPLLNVLEGDGLMPDGVADESVLISKSPSVLIVNISAREAQIGKLLSGDAIGVDVGVNTRDALLVRAVQFGD
jgi:hypothetical protein